jgi:hypothetical protein
MYALGVVSGMLLAWSWLAFASPHARKESVVAGVDVRCIHCGRMYRTGFNNVRVDSKCMDCA